MPDLVERVHLLDLQAGFIDSLPPVSSDAAAKAIVKVVSVEAR